MLLCRGYVKQDPDSFPSFFSFLLPDFSFPFFHVFFSCPFCLACAVWEIVAVKRPGNMDGDGGDGVW